MWVIACGMRRSGSTLLYQIARRLVEDTGRGVGVGATEDYTGLDVLFGTSAEGQRWRVVKTHEPAPEWAATLKAGDARGLYVYRNLYDVLVSASWNDGKVTLDDPTTLRNRAHWLADTYRFWSVQPNTLVLRYADLVGDPIGAVQAVGRHLEMRVSYRWALHLAWTYSTDQQRNRDNGADWRIAQRIHDGRIGAWRDYVTYDQTRVLMDIVSEIDIPELKT
jgi:hypothetical protein